MQKKTLLYALGIAAIVGLAIGAVFFANEVRLKIIQGPDTDQFATESPLELSAAFLSSKKIKEPSPAPLSTPPTPLQPPADQLPEEIPAGSSSSATDAETKKEEEKTGAFSFAIIGDTQRFDPDKADGNLQKAVKSIEEKNVGLVMTEGDLLSSCDGKSSCEKKLGEWKNTLGSLYSKTYEMMGNHDRSGGDKADALWQKFFELPENGPDGYKELVYSFDHENSHFVVLNSENPKEHMVNKVQRDWLEKDLKETQKDNKFIFFHEPGYPVSSKIDESLDTEKSDRDALWKILKDQKVTAVFNGHEHIASRKKADGITQFVFGNTDSFDHDLPKDGVADYSHKGNHFGIVEVNGKEVTVNVYSTDGSLLDSYKLPT